LVRLADTAERLLGEGPAIEPAVQARARLLQIDALLRSEPPRVGEAESLLRQVEPVVQASGDPGLSSDLNLQKFRLAKGSGDAPRARELAEWLAEHASDPAARQMALLFLADAHDQDVQAAVGDERRQAILDAVAFYERLGQILGEDLAAIRRSQNAFVALSRRARYEVLLEQFDRADPRYTLLRQAAPKDLEVLKNAAACKQHLQRFEQAAELWREIVRGVPAGSADWLEAKYHLVLCLHRDNPDGAIAILDQTLHLAPNMDPDWRQRFRELQERVTRSDR
jgi:tetratricopeptide (TPR) repeat protein